MNVVAVAACLAVAVAPAAIVDGGFLLSFGATAAILLGVPALLRVLPNASSRVVRAAVTGVAGMLAATLCAEVALAPIGASLFGRVTFAGLALNLSAIPLMTVVQCAGMARARLVGRLDRPGGRARTDRGMERTVARGLIRARGARALGRLGCRPAGSLVVRRVLRRVCRRADARAFTPDGSDAHAGERRGAAGWAARAVRGGVAAPASAVLRVVVLDVGQGDATLVTLPDGRSVLVDAGGLAGTTFDIGGRVLVPALRALGVVAAARARHHARRPGPSRRRRGRAAPSAGRERLGRRTGPAARAAQGADRAGVRAAECHGAR